MIIYHYDPISLNSTGIGTADRSPLEKDTYLIPAFATTVVPPDYNVDTQTCRFVDSAWVIAEIPITPAGPDQLQKTAEEIRIEAIKSELAALDIKRIRPLAEGDAGWLKTYNDQAFALREELKTLAG